MTCHVNDFIQIRNIENKRKPKAPQAWSRVNNSRLKLSGNLSISARADDTYRRQNRNVRFGHDKNSVATAIGINNSVIDVSGSTINISAFSRGQVTYAYGMLGSTLRTSGNDNKTINISAKTIFYGTDPAYGLSNSSIQTETGHDTINIEAKASGEKNKGWRQWSVVRLWTRKSSLSTGDGNDTINITVDADASYSIEATKIGQTAAEMEHQTAKHSDEAVIKEVRGGSLTQKLIPGLEMTELA